MTKNATASATKEVEAPQPLTIEAITAKNASDTAVRIWGLITGKNFDERQETLQTVITALRSAREADKKLHSRPRKSEDEVITEAIGKTLSELQATNVNIVGVTMKLPNVFKIAADKTHPMIKPVEQFLSKHGLVLGEKQSSRGKASSVLQRAKDWKAPEPQPDAA